MISSGGPNRSVSLEFETDKRRCNILHACIFAAYDFARSSASDVLYNASGISTRSRFAPASTLTINRHEIEARALFRYRTPARCGVSLFLTVGRSGSGCSVDYCHLDGVVGLHSPPPPSGAILSNVRCRCKCDKSFLIRQ